MPENFVPRPNVTINVRKPGTSFKDGLGITHEALHSDLGDVSLCGRLREPLMIDNKVRRAVLATAQPWPPDDVDCMTCVVQRTRLDRMVENTPRQPIGSPIGSPIELALRIKPWE